MNYSMLKDDIIATGLFFVEDIFTIYDVKKITNENKFIFYQYCIVIVIVVYQVKMKVLSVKVKTFNLLIKT